MRLIELTCKDGDHVQRIVKAVVRAEPVDWFLEPPGSEDRRLLRVLVQDEAGQRIIDAIQGVLDGVNGWRVVVLPVEASVPKLPEPTPEEKKQRDAQRKKRRTIALREEMFEDVAKGAVLDPDYLVLTALSTVVAAIGLHSDNVAVVIGAMVIAPLLGPMLALSFGSALGDLQLMGKAGRTGAAGLALGLAMSAAIGLAMDVNLTSQELTARTVVGLDSVALALASGGAAALSIVTGVSATLVGVMVAVALLPPAAAVGLYAGEGEWELSGRAALLLAINVVCVNLAALGVYWWRGVRPRTWLERRSAKRYLWVNLAVWATLLGGLVALMLWANAKGA